MVQFGAATCLLRCANEPGFATKPGTGWAQKMGGLVRAAP
jgi:hypothetical protein